MRNPIVAAALLIIASLIPAGAREQAAMPAAAQASLDAFVNLAIERDLMPGFGLAIVHDGRIVHQRGYGWADREAKRRVDHDTLFYIASCTKAFTALATVMLDRAGVLDLDWTLARLLPEAKLAAGLNPAKITVRQLLTHTHGINADGPVSHRTSYSGEIERASLLRALAIHRPANGGTSYFYSNLGYVITSLGTDRVAGKSWKDVLAERVFQPLGLRSTSARVSELPAGRLAMPYTAEVDGLARLPYIKQDSNLHAAGGIIGSIGDIARFTMAVMDGGVVDGRRIFPADVIAETLRQQATFSGRMGDISRHGYGLGWNLGTLDADAIVNHGGTFPGLTAFISFMPARRLGVIVAGNGGYSAEVQNLVMNYAYALMTGKGDAALARYRQSLDALTSQALADRKALAADRARLAARPQKTALPLAEYVGVYVDDLFGSLDVSLRDGRIHVRNGALESVATVYDGARNALRIELLPGSGTDVSFQVEDGKVTWASYRGYKLVRKGR